MNVNELVGRRCLVKLNAPYNTKTEEYHMIEVSPSGNWVKLMNLCGLKFWKPVVEVALVEVLKDLKPERPPQ